MANRKITRTPVDIQEDTKEVETKTVKETVEKEVKKEELPAKKFDQSDGILCRSVTVGWLFFSGAKTGIDYEFTDYGDETEIEYRDLVHAVRSRSDFIYNPYFIIENEDFIKEFPQLDKFYHERYTTKELKDILKLPINEMVDQISALPSGAIDSLKKICATQIANGQLDSIKKIKALDQIFGTDLNLFSNLFN